MFHGKRSSPRRAILRAWRARGLRDSSPHPPPPRLSTSGNSPALHFGPALSTASPSVGHYPGPRTVAPSHLHLSCLLTLADCGETVPGTRFLSRDPGPQRWRYLAVAAAVRSQR
ncbi:hypothetical protein H920_18215 [Fukomys damarensis]|uniref:Uncharacterized protein n=1 Tax=Fukomys damarensis TaxID=885580 RepID=A0A091DC57_FUKDA|nr:hypothetical protein H920_18215 [Fukomys damarensis]